MNYNFIGEEFIAVFVSTFEPATSSGHVLDPAKSICNDAVFNTVITRSQSLVVCVGNPFRLLHFNKQLNNKCWSEYIQRCIACQSFELVTGSSSSQPDNLYRQLDTLYQQLDNEIKEVIHCNDEVIEKYTKNIHTRSEYKTSFGLIKGPGNVKHMGLFNPGKHKNFRKAKATLEFRDYRNALCKVNGRNIKIVGLNDRKCAFNGDVANIEYNSKTGKGRVVIDAETYEVANKKYFGMQFLSMVDVSNPKMFLPIDKCHPKFSNLPPLVKTYENGVICFDPSSIGSAPKVAQFIPLEVAKSMLFVVCYLRWKPRFTYPLGIVIKALPPCTSITAEKIFKYHYNITCSANNDTDQYHEPNYVEDTCEVFDNVFTIDSATSLDLDDALSCEECHDQPGRFKIGIHITDVSCLVPINSSLDNKAKEIKKNYYFKTDKCSVRMLPCRTSETASLLPQHQVKAFSLVTIVDIIDNKVVDMSDPQITHSLVTSMYKMSYEEAENILVNGHSNCVVEAESLNILWKFAKYLRRLRLGMFCFSKAHSNTILSTTLVEELMIFMNSQVAQFLVKATFPVILRGQDRPNQRELRDFVDEHKPKLICFPSTEKLVYQFYPSSQPNPQIEFSCSILDKILHKDSNRALHYLVNQFNHPMYLALNNMLISLKRKSYYYLNTSVSRKHRHDDLCLEMYTHFTSPIRRYVDIVMQRLLTAVLNNDDSPYTEENLQEIIDLLKNPNTQYQNYVAHVDEVDVACQMKDGCQEYLGTVAFHGKNSTTNEIHITYFNDLSLHESLRHIRIQHLKARKFNLESFQGEWKVRMCSLKGKTTFLSSRTDIKWKDTSGQIEAKILKSKDGTADENTIWSTLMCRGDVEQTTVSVSFQKWSNVLLQFENDEENDHSEFTELIKSIEQSCKEKFSTKAKTSIPEFSPLWIINIKLSLQPQDVMKVWLTSTNERNLLTPIIQLIELDPSVCICIQHNRDLAKIFAGRLTNSVANKFKYENKEEYHRLWQPLLVAEAASDSVNDTDIMILQDVEIKWPQLDSKYDSMGKEYFCIPKKQNASIFLETNFLETSQPFVNIHTQFVEASLPFFDINFGCLLCIRYKEEFDGTIFVLHMVIESVKIEKRKVAKIDLVFVNNDSNHINQKLQKLLLLNKTCEVQLIPVSLPHK